VTIIVTIFLIFVDKTNCKPLLVTNDQYSNKLMIVTNNLYKRLRNNELAD
jgi:hypothetical protein